MDYYFSEQIEPSRFEQEVIETFPLPLAASFERLLRHPPSDRKRATAEKRLLLQITKYPCLILLADYFASEQVAETVNRCLVQMKINPSQGKWLELWRELSTRYEAVHPAARECGQAHERLERSCEVRLDHPGEGLSEPLGLISGLIKARNELEHSFIEVSSGQSEDFYQLLLSALGQLRHLRQFPLCRAESDSGSNEVETVELRGASAENFPRSTVSTEGTPLQQGDLFVHAEGAGLLPVNPLLVEAACPICSQEKGIENARELFMYERPMDSKVAYLGFRHPLNLTERFAAAVESAYASKQLDSAAGDLSCFEDVRAAALRTTGLTLSDLVGSNRYIPEAFVPRVQLQADLDRFCDDRTTALLLLTGDSGIGKTSVLARVAETLAEREDQAVVFFSCAGRERNDFEMLFREIFASGKKLQIILEALGSERPEGGQLVIIADGVNESPHAKSLLKSAASFGHRVLQSGVPLKLILSIRATTYRQLAEIESKVGRDFFSHPGDFFSPREDASFGSDEDQAVRMERMTAAETEEAYEAYRQIEGFGTLTPYPELTPSVQDLLHHPWYMRLMLVSFAGEEVPPTTSVSTLCRKLQGALHEINPFKEVARRGRFLRSFVGHLYRKQSSDASLSELLEDPDATLREEVANPCTDSDYVQLLDHGILREVSGGNPFGSSIFGDSTRVRFAFEKFYDFLMGDYLLHERIRPLDDEGGRERLVELIENAGDQCFLQGPLVSLFQSLVESGQTGSVVSAVTEADTSAGDQAIEEVLFDLAVRHDPLTETLRSRLADTSCFTSLSRVAQRLGYSGDYEEAHAIYSAVIDLATSAANTRVAFDGLCARAELAVLGNRYQPAETDYRSALELLDTGGLDGSDTDRGRILAGLARSVDAQGDSAATEIYHQARELLNGAPNRNYVLLLNDFGVLRMRQGAFDEAEQLCREAEAICRDLDMARELAVTRNSIALILHKRAAAAENEEERISLLGQSENHYREALETAEEIGDRWEQIFHLNNLGTIRMECGDHETAEALFSRAEDLAKRLGDIRGQALTLCNQGLLRSRQKDFAAAIDLLRKALSVAEQADDAGLAAFVTGSLGRALGWSGETGEGLELLDQAISDFENRNMNAEARPFLRAREDLRLIRRLMENVEGDSP